MGRRVCIHRCLMRDVSLQEAGMETIGGKGHGWGPNRRYGDNSKLETPADTKINDTNSHLQHTESQCNKAHSDTLNTFTINRLLRKWDAKKRDDIRNAQLMICSINNCVTENRRC